MCYVFRLVQFCLCKLLIVVIKFNVQCYGMVMWDEIVVEVVQEFLDVQWDKMLVDVMMYCMMLYFQILDIIVVINLYVDIFFDLVGVLVGSLGVVLIVNIDFECCFFFMFELIYGFVFDIIGKGIVNFIVIFWIVVQMFEYLGECYVVVLIMESIEYVCEKGILMLDVGGLVNIVEVICVVVYYIDVKVDIVEIV